MIEKVVEEFRRRGSRPQPVDSVACMADLVPRHVIAEVTTLFDAPFRNTFGSTETGPAPGGGRAGRVAVGVVAQDLAKSQSSMCQVRLVDEEGRDVGVGEPGELLLRSASLFSGYWGMPEATAEAFAGGWFHTGDVFTREADGALQFVDRRKYLIKSGGENIYPAEIEQLLLASPRIIDAVVVRKADAKWGEVPVAFVATDDASLTPEDVVDLCRGRIAGYKMPREVRFIRAGDMPRNTTGKVMRNLLEDILKKEPA
jgi:fatty-acyl-CoA synthase